MGKDSTPRNASSSSCWAGRSGGAGEKPYGLAMSARLGEDTGDGAGGVRGCGATSTGSNRSAKGLGESVLNRPAKGSGDAGGCSPAGLTRLGCASGLWQRITSPLPFPLPHVGVSLLIWPSSKEEEGECGGAAGPCLDSCAMNSDRPLESRFWCGGGVIAEAAAVEVEAADSSLDLRTIDGGGVIAVVADAEGVEALAMRPVRARAAAPAAAAGVRLAGGGGCLLGRGRLGDRGSASAAAGGVGVVGRRLAGGAWVTEGQPRSRSRCHCHCHCH